MLNDLKREIKNRAKATIDEYSCTTLRNLKSLMDDGGIEGYLSKLNVKLSDKNKDGVIVVYDDKIIKATRTIAACTGLLRVQGVQTPVIIIEERFKDSPLAEALYYHELGHIKNEVGKKQSKGYRFYSYEIRADLYAVEKIGAEKVLNCLKAIREETFGQCTKELDMRIAEITVRCGLYW